MPYPPGGETQFSFTGLLPGTYHEDEVPADAAQKTWFGIFKNRGGFYTAFTSIKTNRVADPLLDEDSQKTGWEVSIENEDSCLFLVSDLTLPELNYVRAIRLPRREIYPGDTLPFRYGGQSYSLFATGGLSGEESYSVWNYKLYLSGQKNGKSVTQLLMDVPHFDDAMAQILFVGDVDGDQIPDLLIDTSNHYNLFAPTLFLSSQAEEGELVKMLAQHRSAGC